MAGLRWQIPVNLFYRSISKFFPFPFFERLDQRIWQMARDSREIPTDSRSGMRGIQVCFLLNLFQVMWKTHIINFLENCSANSRNVWGLWARYSSSIKVVRHEWRLPHNLAFIFQVENVTWRNRKSVECPWHYSTDFHQVFTKMIALSNSSNICPWKYSSSINIYKNAHFGYANMSKKLPDDNR